MDNQQKVARSSSEYLLLMVAGGSKDGDMHCLRGNGEELGQ
jgi:hypothetical protein